MRKMRKNFSKCDFTNKKIQMINVLIHYYPLHKEGFGF